MHKMIVPETEEGLDYMLLSLIAYRNAFKLELGPPNELYILRDRYICVHSGVHYTCVLDAAILDLVKRDTFVYERKYRPGDLLVLEDTLRLKPFREVSV